MCSWGRIRQYHTLAPPTCRAVLRRQFPPHTKFPRWVVHSIQKTIPAHRLIPLPELEAIRDVLSSQNYFAAIDCHKRWGQGTGIFYDRNECLWVRGLVFCLATGRLTNLHCCINQHKNTKANSCCHCSCKKLLIFYL